MQLTDDEEAGAEEEEEAVRLQREATAGLRPEDYEQEESEEEEDENGQHGGEASGSEADSDEEDEQTMGGAARRVSPVLPLSLSGVFKAEWYFELHCLRWC